MAQASCIVCDQKCVTMFMNLKACACCAEPLDDPDFDVCPECRDTIDAIEEDAYVVSCRNGRPITNQCDCPNCTADAMYIGKCLEHYGKYIRGKFQMFSAVSQAPNAPALPPRNAPALPPRNAPALPPRNAPALPPRNAPALPPRNAPALPPRNAPALPSRYLRAQQL